jgi:hypothetical protein
VADISSAYAARTSVYPRLDRVVPRRGLGVLCAVVALSAFDRLLIAPLLTSIAQGLAVSLGAVSLVVTVHFVSYGLAQVGHGLGPNRARARAAARASRGGGRQRRCRRRPVA